MSNETKNTSGIVNKVWAFCNTLRDDGLGYGDCLKQDLEDLKICRMGSF
ncbi:MAG: hypothetical protein SFU21_09695 [Flavihumibacter sp.]|nr:hypothetical protein [Flavihumibacter sp.]